MSIFDGMVCIVPSWKPTGVVKDIQCPGVIEMGKYGPIAKFEDGSSIPLSSQILSENTDFRTFNSCKAIQLVSQFEDSQYIWRITELY